MNSYRPPTTDYRAPKNVQVAPGIYHVALPLPFPLRIVNCYLLHGDDGWTVLDTGLNYATGRAAWREAFATLGLEPQDIARIVLTHCHPDHFGMAGWLQEQSGAPVLLAPREIELAQQTWTADDYSFEHVAAFFASYGLPADLARGVCDNMAELRAQTLPHPQLTPLAPGSSITMGDREFTTIHAPGHSDGQLIFYDTADRLLLCGDQVLIKITPHIGMWPESEPDPLGRYLASLDTLAELHVCLALPGHGPPIDDWRGRIAEIRQHHAERLDLMTDLAGEGANAFEICAGAFKVDTLSFHQLRFALAETLAHLDLLERQGRVRRTTEGVVRYQAIQDNTG